MSMRSTGKKGIPANFFYLTFLSVFTFTLVSCGEAGIGFNVTKEVPVDVPIFIDIPDPEVDANATALINDLLNVNPPSESFNYNLNEVGAFDDALEDIGDEESIVVNAIFYEVTGVDESEEVLLDELSVTVTIAGEPLTLLSFRAQLSDTEKRPISLTEAQKESIIAELRSSEEINSEVIFDLSELPSSSEDINFDFRMYFDLTLRARDL